MPGAALLLQVLLLQVLLLQVRRGHPSWLGQAWLTRSLLPTGHAYPRKVYQLSDDLPGRKLPVVSARYHLVTI